MIPKIIHYCWFGNGTIPAYLQNCIDTWKKVMPDYEIKRWDETNFDVSRVPYVKDAYEKKKYAFVSDYARIYVLYNEGGIYLDTDVVVKRRFDPFLVHKIVTGIEWHKKIFYENQSFNELDENFKRKDPQLMDVVGCGVLAAVMMGERRHPYFKDILTFYENSIFTKSDGTYNLLVSPAIYAVTAEKYGFRYKNENQNLGEGFVVYSDSVFSLRESATVDSFAIHIGNGSWIDDVNWRNKISRFMRHHRVTNYIYMFLTGKNKESK